MGVNVGNKFAETATFSFEEVNGKTKMSVDGGDSTGAAGIGATNAVGPKTVETTNGGYITELRDTIGGTMSADDVAKIFDALTLGGDNANGKGAIDGINGVTLVGLTNGAFTIEIDNGRAVDTLVFEVGDDWFDQFNQGQDIGDQKSKFGVVEQGETIIGSSGLLGGAVGGSINGEADLTTILAAAIDQDETTVDLLGLEGDSFSVQISRGGKTDTYVFTGEDAAAAVQTVQAAGNDLINPGNKKSQIVVLEDGDSGTIGIGTGGHFDGAVGGTLSVDDVVSLMDLEGTNATGLGVSDVNVVDQGDTTRVELAGSSGTVDIVIVPDSVFDTLIA